MTSEERQQLNSLVIGIQGESDYDRFAAQAREIYDLTNRKARRFGHPGAGNQSSNRPSRTVPAVVKQILKPVYPDQSEKVEISITEADELFREVRIVNMLRGVDGKLVGFKQGARVDVTFEAEIDDTVARFKDSDA